MRYAFVATSFRTHHIAQAEVKVQPDYDAIWAGRASDDAVKELMLRL